MGESQHDLRINVGIALRNAISSALQEELQTLERSITAVCDEVLNIFISPAPGVPGAAELDSCNSSRRHSLASVARRPSTQSCTQSIYNRFPSKKPQRTVSIEGKSGSAHKSALAKQIEAKRRGLEFKGMNLHDLNHFTSARGSANAGIHDTSPSESSGPSPCATLLHIPQLTKTEPPDDRVDSSADLPPRITTDSSHRETEISDDNTEATTEDTLGDMLPMCGSPHNRLGVESKSPSMVSSLSSMLSPSGIFSGNGNAPAISPSGASSCMTSSKNTDTSMSLRTHRGNKRLSSLLAKQNESANFRKEIFDKIQKGKRSSDNGSRGAAFTDIANPSSSNQDESPTNGRRATRATKRLTSMVPNLTDIHSKLAKISPRLFDALSPVESPDTSFVDACNGNKEDCIDFELRDAWNIEFHEGEFMEHKSSDAGGVGLAKARSQFLTNKGSEPEMKTAPIAAYKPPRWMISPHAPRRLVWDVFSAFFILYDGVSTPLAFFEMKPTTFTIVMQWIIRIFWSMDMPITCLSGYTRQDGEVEMNPRAVFARYFKTWLFIDIVVVSADWLDVLLETGGFSAGGNAARLSKIMRIVRIVRMVRLLRVGRLPQIFERLSDLMPMHINFVIRAAASVLKIMGLILLLTHCIACAWYAVGDMGGAPNWIDEHTAYELANNETYAGDKGYLYLTAFHWSLTQFSGSMEVFPTNARERLLAVLTLLFSFMASNIFVSSLTSSMTRFQLAASRQTKMFAELRRYLEKNDITPSLAIKLNRNALFAYKEEQRNIKEDDIELLKLVSEPLRIELHSAIYAPVLNRHAFFATLAEIDCPGQTNLQTRICHKDVSMRRFMPGDIIFTYGEEPEDGPEFLQMLFLTSGKLRYTRPNGNGTNSTNGAESAELVEEIEKGTWLCEAVLWVRWMFFGELRATGTCTLVLIGSEEMQNITNSTKMPKIAHYAKGFAHVLSKTPLGKMTDVGSAFQVEAAMAHAENFAAGEYD